MVELDGCIYTWIRFGAETEDGEFLFYGNAVTKENTAHRYRTFGDIEKELIIKYQK